MSCHLIPAAVELIPGVPGVTPPHTHHSQLSPQLAAAALSLGCPRPGVRAALQAVLPCPVSPRTRRSAAAAAGRHEDNVIRPQSRATQAQPLCLGVYLGN